MSVRGDDARAKLDGLSKLIESFEGTELEGRATREAQNKSEQELERLRTDSHALWEAARDLTGKGGCTAEMAKNLTALRDALRRVLDVAAIPIEGRTFEGILEALGGRVANGQRVTEAERRETEVRAELAREHALLQASCETSAGLRQRCEAAMVALDALRVELERTGAPRSCLDAVERALRGAAPAEATVRWSWAPEETSGWITTPDGTTLAGVVQRPDGWYWWASLRAPEGGGSRRTEEAGPMSREEAIARCEAAAQVTVAVRTLVGATELAGGFTMHGKPGEFVRSVRLANAVSASTPGFTGLGAVMVAAPSPAGNLSDRVAELEARLARLEGRGAP